MLQLPSSIILTTLLLISSINLHAHDMYSNWKANDGTSCCNSSDCQPTVERLIEDHYEAYVNGEWVKIPDSKIRNQPSPDGQPHICMTLNYVRCYQPGMGS